MRFGSIWLALASGTALALLATSLVACSTGDDDALPDAFFNLDGGPRDGMGPDVVRFPDASVDTCVMPGSTVGNACASDEQCQDGCFCDGRERCEMGACVAATTPCTDAVDCTDESCLEELDQCFVMPVHLRCGNGDACDGTEMCDPLMGCRSGAPLYCNDENSCTVDSCDPAMGCVYEVRDLDRDGFTDGRCGGMDCDDDPRFGTMIYPGAMENCTNRRDDNCDGLRDFADPSCHPMNDACASAQFLPAAGTYSGSTEGLTSNYPLACSTGAGPDAVFWFHLDAPHDVRVTVGAGGFGTNAVAIRPLSACATGPEIRCNAASPPSLLQRSLDAGDWAIIVKTSAGVDFDVTLMISDPTPVPRVDTCVTGVTQDVSAGGTFTGNFDEVEDDYRLSCNAGTGFKDAAYRFVVPPGMTKDVTITGTAMSPSWMPTTYLSLTTACGTAGSELACNGASTAMIRRRELPPGEYYILLESSNADSTSWSITVTITDPTPRAPGDACSSALNITSTAAMPRTPVGVTLGGLEYDYGTSCGGGTASYRDAVYYFDVPAGGADVTLETASFGTHYVAVETTCGVRATELSCRTGPSPLRRTWRSMAAGRYYVVASTTSGVGTGTGLATLTVPPTVVPPNDSCTGPTSTDPATWPTTIMGDLGGYQDDVAGCTGSALTDVMYTFTIPAGGRFTTIVASRITGTGNITMTLRAACASGASTACPTPANPVTIAQMLPAGTYYLIVEMAAGTEGQYRIQFI